MPGVSHQAVTDTIHMASNPNMRLFEPSNKREIELSLLRAVEEFGPSYIRMQSIGVPQSEPHEDLDTGTIWNLGEAIIIVCSGVSILEQAQKAVALLKSAELNVSLLTVFDINKLPNSEALNFISKHSLIVVIENSLPGNLLKVKITEEVLNKSKNQPEIYSLGLNSLPICGQNEEVLEYHGLSADKMHEFILSKTKM
jgi:transketolase C-terminal domain/subunit